MKAAPCSHSRARSSPEPRVSVSGGRGESAALCQDSAKRYHMLGGERHARLHRHELPERRVRQRRREGRRCRHAPCVCACVRIRDLCPLPREAVAGASMHVGRAPICVPAEGFARWRGSRLDAIEHGVGRVSCRGEQRTHRERPQREGKHNMLAERGCLLLG